MELQFCNDNGLPHSKFLKWKKSDRAKALAFILEKGERCQMCGTAGWEWIEDRFAYEPVEKFCQGCYMIASADDPDPQRNKDGITIELLPTRTIEAAQRYMKEKQRYEEREREARDKSRVGL